MKFYSSRLSVGWIGLGESNVIKGPTLNFAYDLKKLRDLLRKLTNDGGRVIMLVCYAGDSRSMTFDNFIELRAICDEYGIWMHCDGCQGTQLVFSRRFRKEKLKGIESADSITMDPHKILNLPYSVSVLLIKDQKVMELIRRPEDIITGEEHSFGQLTPFFGSRNFMSLKLYFLIKNLGLDGLEEVVERRCQMANVVSDEIAKSSKLLQINEKIELNSVIFMYFPREISSQLPSMVSAEHLAIVNIMNDINVRIQDRLFSAGDIWLHTFLIPDLSNALKLSEDEPRAKLRPLRFMSGNPILNEKHISQMLSRVVAEGDVLLRNFIENMNSTDPLFQLFSNVQFIGGKTNGFNEFNGVNGCNGVYGSDGVNGSNDENGSNGVNGSNDENGSNGVESSIYVDKGFSIRNNIASVSADDNNYLSRDEFCKRKTELIVEIRRFCAEEFRQPNESYFVVVYGSYGYGYVKPKSDLDIVFYCKDEHCSDERRSKITEFVEGLHRKHQMQLDNEIPYEDKILLPYSFLKSACQGDGILTKSADGQQKWEIPEIEKTREYLTSANLLLRFFMGVFFNQNFLVSGSVHMYNKCKGLATRNLVKAVISINGRTKVNSMLLAKDFCLSPRGTFGDYFLGFSDREPFTSYLLEFIELTLGTMNLQHLPDADGTSYLIQSDDLKPECFNDF